MQTFFDQSFEFVEVINQFPVLKRILRKHRFDLTDTKDGESIEDFFVRNRCSTEEVELLVHKLNRDVSHYLKNGNPEDLDEEEEILEEDREEE